jgi:hypothetical protein
MADLQLSLYFDVFGVEILILIIVEAGIERLGLTSGLKFRSQLPGLEDRLDPADKKERTCTSWVESDRTVRDNQPRRRSRLT